jgi:hypothetical protein
MNILDLNEEIRKDQCWFLYQCAIRNLDPDQVDRAIERGRDKGFW